MAHTAQTTNYFSTGEIKFSQIRSIFGFSVIGPLKASNLIRDTDLNSTDPKIPDATENLNIPSSVGGESANEWKASYFRNTIKSYKVIQSGSEDNLTFSSINSWNSNLDKNIKKTYSITGTIKGTSSTTPALTLDGSVYNLTVEVSGYVLGYGGLGGVRGATGSTENVSSNVSANILIAKNSKDSEEIYLQTSGTGTATVEMYAGMRDYQNGDKRPWRYIYFTDDAGVQSVYVDPGPTGSNSDRELDFNISLSVTGGNSYRIDPTNLQKGVSWLVNYGIQSTAIPSGTIVSGFSMRDADNDICRGQVKIGSITQGTFSREKQGTNGENGGDAINVTSTGSKIKISELSGGNRIRGGGGGGGAGNDGTDGSGGTCDTYDEAVNSRFTTTRCKTNNLTSDEAKEICSNNGYTGFSRTNSQDCCEREASKRVCVKQNKNGVCKEYETKLGACLKWNTYVYCWNNYTTAGGSKGLGGNGGRGRGSTYNELDGFTSAPIDSPGYNAVGGPTYGSGGGGCGATKGTDGVRGGSGGAWNAKGGDVTGAGSGGAAGSKISGSNWTY